MQDNHFENAPGSIQKRKSISDEERAAILERTAGSLTEAEGEELNRIIEEGCEQIDE